MHRIECRHVDWNLPLVVEVDWKAQAHRDPQTICGIELGKGAWENHRQASFAELVLQKIGPYFV
jgi:hypothetical protein